MTRVSVDKAALDDFIKSARSDNTGLCGEYATSREEEALNLAGFEQTVSALDIKELA